MYFLRVTDSEVEVEVFCNLPSVVQRGIVSVSAGVFGCSATWGQVPPSLVHPW